MTALSVLSHLVAYLFGALTVLAVLFAFGVRAMWQGFRTLVQAQEAEEAQAEKRHALIRVIQAAGSRFAVTDPTRRAN